MEEYEIVMAALNEVCVVGVGAVGWIFVVVVA